MCSVAEQDRGRVAGTIERELLAHAAADLLSHPFLSFVNGKRDTAIRDADVEGARCFCSQISGLTLLRRCRDAL